MRRKRTRIGRLRIPPILLEGDLPTVARASGPGRRYTLGSGPPVERPAAAGELPEAYGTRQLLLAARDPHWLYAHWDLTSEQQRRYNARSAGRHLILRIYIEAIEGRPAAEIHVHPESRHWFIHVDRAGTQYVCELGFYARNGAWETISTSNSTRTPPDKASADTSVQFATIPFESPLVKLLLLVKGAGRGDVPLSAGLEPLRTRGHPQLPPPVTPPVPAPWTPAQERALAEAAGMDSVRRIGTGSLAITELSRGQPMPEVTSLSAAQPGSLDRPAEAGGAVSSPSGAARPGKGFWFNVNAELIVYGATEPTAAVTVGGRAVKLRPDGSFSCRFALPDGQYELPLVAVSADQTDGRAVELWFSRSTERRGDVGSQTPEPGLGTPGPATP
jgi:hypothetical protein